VNLNLTEQLLAAYAPFFPEGVIGSYVNGEILAGDGDDIKLVNPTTGGAFLSYKDAGTAVVTKAAEAAVAGQRVWAALSHAERGRIMQEIGRLLRANIEPLAQLA